MRSLDQIYGSDGVLYVMTPAGVLVNPIQDHIDFVVTYWQSGVFEFNNYSRTIRDLMLAGF